jgi:hypothetical protein
VFYYTEDLTSAITLRTLAPIAQTTFQTSDLIQIANDEMQLKLVSDIQTIREDFFLQSQDQALVASQQGYYIPSRAVGNALKAVTYVDPQGNESAPLNRVPVERSYMFSSGNSVPIAFYVASDQIMLLPKPNLGQGTIRLYFFQRPNQLVSTTSCAKITSISSAGGTSAFTVNTDLTGSLSIGSTLDFLRVTNPFMLWAKDVAITAINSTTISVATTGVIDVNSNVLPTVGDYICPAGKANIPQIPQEFHPVLAQMGAVRLLAALGDLNKLAAAKQELAEVRRESVKLIKNRVESAPEKVDTRGGLMGRVGTRYGLR